MPIQNGCSAHKRARCTSQGGVQAITNQQDKKSGHLLGDVSLEIHLPMSVDIPSQQHASVWRVGCRTTGVRVCSFYGARAFLSTTPSRRTPEIAQYLSLLAPMKYWNACETRPPTSVGCSCAIHRSHVKCNKRTAFPTAVSASRSGSLSLALAPLLLHFLLVPLLQRNWVVCPLASESAVPDITSLPLHQGQLHLVCKTVCSFR